MLTAIIKIIIGLFFWLALPGILVKPKSRNKGLKLFIRICCMILGIILILYGSIDIIKDIINM